MANMQVSISKKISSFALIFLLLSCSERTINTIQSPLIACPTIVSGNSSSMSSDLSIITTAEDVADTISGTQLTVPGDSQSYSDSDINLSVYRQLPGQAFNSGTITIGSYTASISVPSNVTLGGSETVIDHDAIAFNSNFLANYYAPSETWNSPLVAYRIVDSSNTSALAVLSSLNSSGDPVAVTLPCDTSSCTTDCTCQCYHWNFTSNRWTQNGVTTTQGSGNVTCSSYLPVAYMSVFAVQNGCE